MGAHFKMALASPLRHRRPFDLAEDLKRFKSKGFTGLCIENDYLGVPLDPVGQPHFTDNWRIFNLFDFTRGKHRARYRRNLQELCALCEHNRLELYVTFWLPRLNGEMLAYLRKHRPRALGRSTSVGGEPQVCLCTCEAGDGLNVLGEMVEEFMREFPQVRGLKVATEDNYALNCEPSCPHAHGASRARHVANMFATVHRSMLRARPDARLLLYPWFWRAGYTEEILEQLKGDYFIVTKMESGAVQQIEEDIEGEPLFDSSIVADKPGKPFLDWIKVVGPERIVDMVPMGTGIDDFFLANPPYPGRLYRRFRQLAKHGVRRFIDFECGGHCAGSDEEAFALFRTNPGLSEKAFLRSLAVRMYRDPRARQQAVAGWQAFDRGFGQLPIGLGETGRKQFSGRFGFAWSMCIATPLLQRLIGEERGHEIHWFSPYNFFTPSLAPRLGFHFQRVLAAWTESLAHLAVADRLEGETEASRREYLAVQARVLSIHSVLHWCLAARLDDKRNFRDLMRTELELTERFHPLLRKHPWLWDNNCWHPHRTPLSQKQISPLLKEHKDVFRAKIEVMRRELARS
jgi:hypothetical protein